MTVDDIDLSAVPNLDDVLAEIAATYENAGTTPTSSKRDIGRMSRRQTPSPNNIVDVHSGFSGFDFVAMDFNLRYCSSPHCASMVSDTCPNHRPEPYTKLGYHYVSILHGVRGHIALRHWVFCSWSKCVSRE